VFLALFGGSYCLSCGVDGPRVCAACGALSSVPVVPLPNFVSSAFALAPYRSPLGKAVLACKGSRDTMRAADLGAFFASRCAVGPVDLVVPAPSPWTRRVARGFSLPVEMARRTARRLGCPWAVALRVRPGPRQAGLGPQARRRVGTRISSRAVQGRVLLLDDVITTGATVSSCAERLLQEGATSVIAASLVTACLASPSPLPEGVLPVSVAPEER